MEMPSNRSIYEVSIKRNYAYRGFCTRPARDFAVGEPWEYDRQFRSYFRNKALTIDSCERRRPALIHNFVKDRGAPRAASFSLRASRA